MIRAEHFRDGNDSSRPTVFPVFVCDACQRRITNVRDGICVVAVATAGRAGDQTSVFHAHKGTCAAAVQAQLDGLETRDLVDHLYDLIHASRVTIDDLIGVQLDRLEESAETETSDDGDD